MPRRQHRPLVISPQLRRGVRIYQAGARTEDARRSWREYCRLAHAHRATAIPDDAHGTNNGYTNYGCRCVRCTIARSTYAQQYTTSDVT